MVATHGSRLSRQSSRGLTVPSTAPLVESVNLMFPIGPTSRPGRTLAVRIVVPDGASALGAGGGGGRRPPGGGGGRGGGVGAVRGGPGRPRAMRGAPVAPSAPTTTAVV